MQQYVRTPIAYFERNTIYPFYPKPQTGTSHEKEIVVYASETDFKILFKFDTVAAAQTAWVKFTTQLDLTILDDIDGL